MYKFRLFMQKVEASMTPTKELIITIFFGFTGIRWFIHGKIGIFLRMFLTFGLFGVGWIIDIISCMIACLQEDDTNNLVAYTVIDSNYPDFKDNCCYWHCEGYAWLDDIENAKIVNPLMRLHNVYEDYSSCTSDEVYRRRLYFCKDEIVCTNLEGVDFKYKYEDVQNMDIYNDAIVICDNKNRIQTVRLNSVENGLYEMLCKIFKSKNISRKVGKVNG